MSDEMSQVDIGDLHSPFASLAMRYWIIREFSSRMRGANVYWPSIDFSQDSEAQTLADKLVLACWTAFPSAGARNYVQANAYIKALENAGIRIGLESKAPSSVLMGRLEDEASRWWAEWVSQGEGGRRDLLPDAPADPHRDALVSDDDLNLVNAALNELHATMQGVNQSIGALDSALSDLVSTPTKSEESGGDRV